MKRTLAYSLTVLIGGFLLFTACGRGAQHRQPSPLQAIQSPAAMQDILAQVEGFQAPPGVDAGVFQQLKDELARQLTTRLQGKSASTAPSGDGNRVMDLQASLDGDGNCALEWGYRNAGDYDLSGQVDIADITPIAIHFGQTSEDAGWEDARAADGDGNGAVGIADITPLAVNYAIQVQSYAVYGADDLAGPWTFEQEASLADAPKAEGARRFNLALGIPVHTLYRVVPRDASSSEGVPSAAAAVVAGGGEVTLDIATETIGSEGGSLELVDGTRLIIPPGALAAGVELTLAKIVLGEGALFGGPGFANYDLSGSALPSAFTFIHPAPQGLDPAQLAVAYYDPHDATEYLENLSARNGDLLPMSYAANTGIITATLGSGTSRAAKAISDGTARLSITQSSTYTVNTTQVLVRAPYYAQVIDGACWAACATMLSKGQGVDMEVSDYIKQLGMDDDQATWGMATGGVYGSLSNQMYQNSQYIQTSWSCFRYNSLRNMLIEQLDKGNPSILFLPAHAVLVVGYEKSTLQGQDAYSFIIHDPKNDATEGLMYTTRNWSEIVGIYDAAHISFTIDSMTILYSSSGVKVSGEELCTIGVPSGQNEGFISFEFGNEPVDHLLHYMYFTWMPSAADGYKWMDGAGVLEFSPIPNYVTNLKMNLPCWNASDQPFSGNLEVTVSGATSPYTVPVTIPASGSSTAWLSIPVNDFRETDPDNQPTSPVEHTVTVKLMGTSGAVDTFSFKFKLQPGAHIDTITPDHGALGDEVTITGTNFGAATGRGRYVTDVVNYWGEGVLVETGPNEIVSWSDTEIVFKEGIGWDQAPEKVKVITGTLGSNGLLFNELYRALEGADSASVDLRIWATKYYSTADPPEPSVYWFIASTMNDFGGYAWVTPHPPLTWVDKSFTFDNIYTEPSGTYAMHMEGTFTTQEDLTTVLTATYSCEGADASNYQRFNEVLSFTNLPVSLDWGRVINEVNGADLVDYVTDLILTNEWGGPPPTGSAWVTDFDWANTTQPTNLVINFTVPTT